MRKKAEIFFEFILLLSCILCLWQSDLVLYGIAQAKGQIGIVINTRPIEEVLKDPDFPDSLKRKLLLVQEVKKFAIDSLGIEDSKNYTTVYDQKGKTLLWVLTACEPFQLKAKEWKFPLLGSVSYKGFFDKTKGETEEQKLKSLNYDTDLGRVGGWSTLGLFKDPILSNMLLKTESSLENLIIHELTHGTVYIKNNVSFNENLASFIGDIGTIKFTENKFGKKSRAGLEYEQDKKEGRILDTYISKSSARLDSLYKTFKAKDTFEYKNEHKNEMLKSIAQGLNSLPLENKNKYDYLGKKIMKEKNAFFVSYNSYNSQQDIFEKEFKERFNSDVRKYLAYLKQKYPSV